MMSAGFFIQVLLHLNHIFMVYRWILGISKSDKMVKKKEGPDQGRSWAIAMAGFVINGLLSGISRTTGLFYVSLIQTYGITRMQANMPFTLRNVVRNLSSPLAGMIGQRYGVREISFVGGILASLGIILCTFSPNAMWVCILWGGVHGFGVALGNTLFPVIINQYFEKHRATASGIALSGACVGSFVLPAAVEYLLKDVGLSGAFLISGGFIMHVLPAAIMMKEAPWIQSNISSSNKSKVKEINIENHAAPIAAGLQKSCKVEQSLDDTQNIFVSKLPLENDLKKANEECFRSTTQTVQVLGKKGVDNLGFLESDLDIYEKKTEFAEFDDGSAGHSNTPQEVRMRTISIGEISITVPKSPTAELQETSMTQAIYKMLSNPMFYIISISLGGFAMLFDPTITVIVDYIKDKGLQERDAKYFISTMSLGDLVGRLCFGWVTDRKYMSLPRFMLLLQVMQGVCFLLLPLFGSLEILMMIILIYGLSSGASLVMYPILVSKYLVSVQSLAIGSISLLTGLLSFAVPPLIGYFRDHVGSYEGMFIITGSLSVIIGCLWFLEPLLTQAQKSHNTSVEISS